ncbi:MAG: AI-2E family transporter YdiK [Sulfuricaulis sp.]|uniref:AI-2E family transporter YdiK n=1 Tax=Sulfuricaulis sp. TaxID=2003553 RepID=UPI003C651005
MPDVQRDLTRTVLAVLFIGGLIGVSFWVLRPFLGALIWAVMIVVATWPLMRAVQTALGGRRGLAVTVMTLVLLLLLILPFSAAIGTIVANVDVIAEWTKTLSEFKVPPPPSWLAGLPVVGEHATQLWQEVAAQGVEALAAKAAPYAGDLTKWFVSHVGSVGVVFIQFLLIVVIAAILYAHGEYAADWVRRFGGRLAGVSGEAAVRLSAQAIRGVALGVVVTALVQALLGGLGLLIAGVPFAAILTAVMFMLSVAQIGAAPVLVVAVVWLFWNDAAGWGTFLLAVTVVVGTLDNVLRPILIKKGADLPLLLIFAGVIGGLIAFGLIGIFIGPMVLAVGYTLLSAWIEQGESIRRAPTPLAMAVKRKKNTRTP